MAGRVIQMYQNYDKFEQPLYFRYGNATNTSYEYDATTRRLSHLDVIDEAGSSYLISRPLKSP